MSMLVKKTFEELRYQMIDPPLEKCKTEVADTAAGLLEDRSFKRDPVPNVHLHF